MANNTKNIKLTLKIQDKRRTIAFPAPSIEEVILLSLIGSVKAADILYINEISTIFIIG